MSYKAIVVTTYWGEETLHGGDQIIEEERKPRNTGLVNAYGVPIYDIPDRFPIGFDLGGKK